MLRSAGDVTRGVHTRSGLVIVKVGGSGVRAPVVNPNWRQATRASVSSKLEVHTAPQAPVRKTCRAPVANPLTSTLLTSLTPPSSPADINGLLTDVP